jgi:hypothetical protein
MTRHPSDRVLAAAAAATAIALAGCGLQNPDAPSSSAPPSTPASPPPAAAAAASTAAQINRQDHPPAALERSQAAAAAARPMLPALPITAAGVTIAIGGLAPDGRTTILTITSPRGGRRHALAVYRYELRRYGDNGDAYQARVQP